MRKTFAERNLTVPSKREMLLGIACWVMFELGFALLLLPFFDIHSVHGEFWYQIAVFCACFLMTVLCFWSFLKDAMYKLPLRQLLRQVIVGYGLYWLLSYGVSLLIVILERYAPTEQVNVNQETVYAMLNYEPLPMILCTGLLAPVTEECLVRGMIFGPICRKRPWLAYLVSTAVFALLHILSSIGSITVVNVVENFLTYVPSGIVLGWIYQRTRSIAGPIALHCAINLNAILLMNL